MKPSQIYKQVDERAYLSQGSVDKKYYYWDVLYYDAIGPFETLEEAEKKHSEMCEGHYGEAGYIDGSRQAYSQ